MSPVLCVLAVLFATFSISSSYNSPEVEALLSKNPYMPLDIDALKVTTEKGTELAGIILQVSDTTLTLVDNVDSDSVEVGVSDIWNALDAYQALSNNINGFADTARMSMAPLTHAVAMNRMKVES
jgi:hypothetical protein